MDRLVGVMLGARPAEVAADGKHPVFQAGAHELRTMVPIDIGKSEAVAKGPHPHPKLPKMREAEAHEEPSPSVEFFHPGELAQNYIEPAAAG